jgi:hypothetical protein
MSDGLDLERRYRRVLRLLPGYYRRAWEQDMVAAFMESSLTGDPDGDEWTLEFSKPPWREVISVAGLAIRLYLGGADAPRRYFAWGQAVRLSVLALTMLQAVRGLDVLMLTAWSRRVFSWLPVPPARLVAGTPPGIVPPMVWWLVAYAWIVSFAALALGRHRTAQVIAALAIIPDLIWLLQGDFTRAFLGPSLGPWAFWVLLNLVPVLAMTAFHRDTPPTPRWPWLVALAATYLLVAVPLTALQSSGNSAWVPDTAGLLCALAALACLAHAPRAWSRQAAGSGVWSLTLTLLAAEACAYRVLSLTDYLHDPHQLQVGLAELLVLVLAVALIVPDATRAQAATHAPPSPRWGTRDDGTAALRGGPSGTPTAMHAAPSD